MNSETTRLRPREIIARQCARELRNGEVVNLGFGIPTLTANYLRVGTIGLKACIEKVVEGSGFRDRWRRMGRGKGLGIACSAYLCGAGLPIYWNDMPQSGVQLRLDRSGARLHSVSV